jgi:hypothetical protein
MMINSKNKNGLKGQNNLSQGKRSVALGWKMSLKIVRVITFFEMLSLLRTKRHESQFRPKGVFALIIVFARTVFTLFPLPQALPGARISWPFRPKLVYKKASRRYVTGMS